MQLPGAAEPAESVHGPSAAATTRCTEDPPHDRRSIGLVAAFTVLCLLKGSKPTNPKPLPSVRPHSVWLTWSWSLKWSLMPWRKAMKSMVLGSLGLTAVAFPLSRGGRVNFLYNPVHLLQVHFVDCINVSTCGTKYLCSVVWSCKSQVDETPLSALR